MGDRMGQSRFVNPIPAHTRDRVELEIVQIEDRNARWLARRLVEVAYADGYEDGHLAGSREADADREAS